MNKLFKVIIVGSVIAITAGCASTDPNNENAYRNRGAVGGAVLGATAGALAGDASLAAKGAAAGAVAGGVAGSMQDLNNHHETQRTQVLADGFSGGQKSQAEKRAAELEAEIRIYELEKQLAELKGESEISGAQSASE